jgi:ABC-type Fe3+-hydroxamate transport system substrate-binding protein
VTRSGARPDPERARPLDFDRPRADAGGVVHPPAGPAARIASLVPSLTELLIDLGLADRIVARTRYCIHPAGAVATIPAVGGTKKVHRERLRALAPTHAVLNVDENTRAMADALRAFVPHLVVTHPLKPDDNRDLFALFGQVFDRLNESRKLYTAYNEVRAAISAASGRLPSRDVVYLIWKRPWMTVSRDTYVAATLDLVNWRTLCHEDAVRYPVVTMTPAVIKQTDLFFFSSEPYAFTEADLDAFADEYGCPRDKLRLIDGEYCSWYGSRAITGLRYLLDYATALA